MKTHENLLKTPNVYFVKHRVDVKWAGYSTLEAILSGMREIIASGIKYDFVNLVSGQDYPLKSAEKITSFLEQNAGKEFIVYSSFEDWTEAQARVEQFHFTDFRVRGAHMLANVVNMVTPRRKFPLKMKLYGREMFWTLSLECAAYVTRFIDGHPELKRFLKFTWAAEEFIFQTIIMNSPYKDRVVNDHYRYIVWPPRAASPRLLVTDDLNDILASKALFGRKFDINKDENILDLLDKANGC